MRKSMLTVALLFGLMGGTGSVMADDYKDVSLFATMATPVAETLLLASAYDQDQEVVDDGTVLDKKKKKKHKKKSKRSKKARSSGGANDTGAGAGPTGQWDTPQ